VRDAAEYIIGNLNEDGYLTATDEELLEGHLREQLEPEHDHGVVPAVRPEFRMTDIPEAIRERARGHLATALEVVRSLDPLGVGARDLRECLLLQLDAQRHEFELIYQRQKHAAQAPEIHASTEEISEDLAGEDHKHGMNGNGHAQRLAVFQAAREIADKHLLLLQKRDMREVAKAAGCSVEIARQAVDLIRTLDPRPGQRYNRSETRLIEPDVAFVKRGDDYVVVMNDEDMPSLRLNQGYRRMITQDGTEKEVRDYVKERYRSALQLMRNIEQRKNTILRTCEAIVRRQKEFLEKGVESLKPMMIKEVAEEIGVHPSTVSRAVSNKYVHTPQGVYELRFFFSEGVNGPEGAGTPLMLLKRKVKKLIEEEDPKKPLTDDQIANMLQSQGINVTRRTVAKYREDMRIPSTHQRRVRS
jgi:RNA polymerase sigma-54 factor